MMRISLWVDKLKTHQTPVSLMEQRTVVAFNLEHFCQYTDLKARGQKSKKKHHSEHALTDMVGTGNAETYLMM